MNHILHWWKTEQFPLNQFIFSNTITSKIAELESDFWILSSLMYKILLSQITTSNDNIYLYMI